MGEKDSTSKTLESYEDVFADIFNNLLFKEHIIDEEDLIEADPISQYKANKTISSQARDISKFWKNSNLTLALFGIENQVKKDKFMPARVMNYDSANYRKQLSIGKNESLPEYLYPAVTLVIYFGEENWDTNTSLYDCLKIPDKLKPFVNNYKIHLVSIKNVDNSTIDSLQSDFKEVIRYFKLKDEYVPSSEDFKHPQETFDLISKFSGNSDIIEIYNKSVAEGKEIKNMDTYSLKVKQEGIQLGIQEGIQEGIQLGKQEGKQEGIQEGIQLGKQEGKQEGIQEGIQILIKSLQNLNQTKDSIVTTIVNEYKLTKEEATNLINRYWNNNTNTTNLFD